MLPKASYLKKVLFGFFCLVHVIFLHASVIPNRLFSDNMVLQQGTKVPIWGTATEGEAVTIEFAGQKQKTITKSGKWMVWLNAMKSNKTPRELVIKGTNTIVVHQVLVGEVWFCSGQSNMEMPLGSFNIYRGAEGFESELSKANLPLIRYAHIPHFHAGKPIIQTNVAWTVCDSLNAYWYSAVAYFFAKKLLVDKQVPVGIIESSWGGSAIQPWTPEFAITSSTNFTSDKEKLEKTNASFVLNTDNETKLSTYLDTVAAVSPSQQWLLKTSVPFVNHTLKYPAPTTLFNAMVNPCIPYAIRGVLWYQGEANLGDGAFYTTRMEALITSWRKLWQQPNLPFFFVEIADYHYTNWPVKNATPDLLPALREAQKKVLQQVPNTKMVSTYGLGEWEDIHPRKKQPIGEQLAEWAEELIK